MLCLKIALMLMACQQFVVTVEPPAFTVDVEPAPAIIKEVSIPGRVIAKPQTTDFDYVVVFTTRNCSPCDRLKVTTIPNLKAKGIHVVEITDASIAAQYGVSLFPVVLVARNEIERLRWTGYVSAEDVVPFIVKHRANSSTDDPTGTKEDPISSCAPETKTISIRTQAEIDAERHLLEVHRIDASGKTYAEMEIIHDNVHGGDGHHFPGRSSLSVVSGGCLGGVCPTTTNRTSRRRRR